MTTERRDFSVISILAYENVGERTFSCLRKTEKVGVLGRDEKELLRKSLRWFIWIVPYSLERNIPFHSSSFSRAGELKLLHTHRTRLEALDIDQNTVFVCEIGLRPFGTCAAHVPVNDVLPYSWRRMCKSLILRSGRVSSSVREIFLGCLTKDRSKTRKGH